MLCVTQGQSWESQTVQPNKAPQIKGPHILRSNFSATICKTVHHMLASHCLSVLSVCMSVALVYCGQAVGWIRMPLGVEVGLGQGHIVLDADPAPPPEKGAQPSPISAHVCCGQIAEWIKMTLSTEVGFGPGDIVLDGDPAAPSRKGHSSPLFSAHVCCGHGRPSQLLLSSCCCCCCCCYCYSKFTFRRQYIEMLFNKKFGKV